MRAEVECTIQANPLCRREKIEGDQWATRAEYKNKTCSDWAREYEEIDIIDCNQAFGLAEDYERLKQLSTLKIVIHMYFDFSKI